MRKTNYHWFLKTNIQTMKATLLTRGYPFGMVSEMSDSEVRAFYDSGFRFQMAA
jgi:hypothetical protein